MSRANSVRLRVKGGEHEGHLTGNSIVYVGGARAKAHAWGRPGTTVCGQAFGVDDGIGMRWSWAWLPLRWALSFAEPCKRCFLP